MIFFDNDFINNYETNKELLEAEKNLIKSNLTIQKKNKDIILNYMQNFANSNDLIDINETNTVQMFLDELKISLDLCNANITIIEKFINLFDNISTSLSSPCDVPTVLKNYNSSYLDLYNTLNENSLKISNCLCSVSEKSEFKFESPVNKEIDLDNFFDTKAIDSNLNNIFDDQTIDSNLNNTFDTQTVDSNLNNTFDSQTIDSNLNNTFDDQTVDSNLNKAFDNQNNIVEDYVSNANLNNVPSSDETLKIEIPQPLSDTVSSVENNNTSNLNKVKSNENTENKEFQYKENTLVISELTQKVLLPYDLAKVKELYENNTNKYSSIDDVIQKKYTLPIKMFKNPFMARFREAYKLMKYKERASVGESFSLGMELMFNSNLHPAIISACKNLDELDIYLDYLSNEDIHKFNYFKVIFELAPTISKKKKQMDY